MEILCNIHAERVAAKPKSRVAHDHAASPGKTSEASLAMRAQPCSSGGGQMHNIADSTETQAATGVYDESFQPTEIAPPPAVMAPLHQAAEDTAEGSKDASAAGLASLLQPPHEPPQEWGDPFQLMASQLSMEECLQYYREWALLCDAQRRPLQRRLKELFQAASKEERHSIFCMKPDDAL